MKNHIKYSAYIIGLIYFATGAAGFMFWTASKILPGDPPQVRTFRNCAEFYMEAGKVKFVPSGKGPGWVNFRATDEDCG